MYALRLLLFLLFPGFLFAQKHPKRRVNLPETIREVSGMALRPNGELWLLNDSRNPPQLFLFNRENARIDEARMLPALNRDWEDLSVDPAGNLYIGDFGNNRNARRNLRIYRYNPDSKQLDSLLFRYPDQTAFPPASDRDWNFNCEAMVWLRDTLHIFSKNSFKGNFITKHYTLPAGNAAFAAGNKEVTAQLRDSFLLRNRVVTGAALSRDGRTLALTAYIIQRKWGIFPHTKAEVYFFSNFSGSDFFHGKKSRKRLPKFMISRQFESVVHLRDEWWLVANERQGHQKPAIWRIRKKH